VIVLGAAEAGLEVGGAEAIDGLLEGVEEKKETVRNLRRGFESAAPKR